MRPGTHCAPENLVGIESAIGDLVLRNAEQPVCGLRSDDHANGANTLGEFEIAWQGSHARALRRQSRCCSRQATQWERSTPGLPRGKPQSLAAAVVGTFVIWRFIFVVPAAFSLACAACLVAALVTSHRLAEEVR